MNPPKLPEVTDKLAKLVSGSITREEASNWALQWINLDNPPNMKDAVWDALSNLAGADMPTTNREYLFGHEDFLEWLETLKKEG